MSDAETEELRRELEEYKRREREELREGIAELKSSVLSLEGSITELVTEFRSDHARTDERLKKLEEAEKAKAKAAIVAGGGIGGAIVGIVEALRALF